MKATYLIIGFLVVGIALGHGQGHFVFLNGSARTRLGTIDGPLAGPGVWAQMLAGPDMSSLAPVGFSLNHVTNGLVGGVLVTVPSVPRLNLAYVQMVAWDGIEWGTDLSSVPAGRLGRTDIVQVLLSEGFPDVDYAPQFTQPAIVPIPEPSVWSLLALGVAGCWFWLKRKT